MNLLFPFLLLKRILSNKIVLFGVFSIGWVMGLGAVGWGLWQLQQVSKTELIVPSPQPSTAPLGQVVVEVAGAVQHPGLYTTNFGSRWGHVVDQAGGLLPETDLQYLQTNLNLADKPQDGAKLYIPFIWEETAVKTDVIPHHTDLLNLNTATDSELDTLPGVGEKTVEAIVAARPFTTIDELLSKKIVGEKVFIELKKLVSAP